MSTVSFPGDSFVIQTTKYRWAEWRSSSIVVVPSIVSGAPETGWKEIRSLPAWISAVKPGVSVVIVIPCGLTARPASSTRPTPGLVNEL